MLAPGNATADGSGVDVVVCTPYLCPEKALDAPMTPMLQTILQCIAFALVIIADCLHCVFMLRAARTSVYNRSTITILCLLSVVQIAFATANAPLIFLITGLPETVVCKLSAFVTAWWRSATSSFLLVSIWQQYAGKSNFIKVFTKKIFKHKQKVKLLYLSLFVVVQRLWKG